MTAKNTARPLKPSDKPATRPAVKRPTTFERTTAPMPRLQVAAKAEAEPDEEAVESGGPQLSDKDLILRLVEVLKSL